MTCPSGPGHFCFDPECNECDAKLQSRPPTRPETGAMKFGDDWRGVFIRGDNAFHFAMVLDYAIALMGDGDINRYVLKGLRDTLASSDERGAADTQNLKPFAECVK